MFPILSLQVSWITKVSEDSTEAEDSVLGSQLVRTAGTTICPPNQASCEFTVELINDQVSYGHNYTMDPHLSGYLRSVADCSDN